MKRNFSTTANQVQALLAPLKGERLTSGQLTRQNIEMIFESGDTRTELRLVPKVYPINKVITDALNTLTVTLEVKQFRVGGKGNGAPGTEKIFEGRVELPFATWFDQGDYL